MLEESTEDLFEKIKTSLPKEAHISDMRYEGSEVVVYTKSKEFFVDDGGVVRNLVMELRKRILLRPDPSICIDLEEAEETIRKIVPVEAGVHEISFEPEFGKVIIEADKPGLVIGKGGETLKEIRRQTLWSPLIKRSPAIPSDIVKVIRELVHKESKFRKDFLDKVGKRIHSGWKPTEWARVTTLGAFREVGRSAVLVQTPESKVLLDCGVKAGSNEFPYINLPEFNIQALDGIVISHAHMDHAGFVPYLYEMGYDGPLYCTQPTRDLMVLLCMDYIEVMQKEGKNAPYSTKGIKEAVKHCITPEWGEVSDITPDIRLTLLNSGHILGSALTHLHIGEGFHNVMYTSDLKFDRTALFEPASLDFSRAESVLIESTYGAREDIQPRRTESEGELAKICKETAERGGKVLIPSFAVERAQDLMVILERSGFEHTIYLDGMVWDATAIHTTYPEYLNRDLQRLILQQGYNPLTAPIFKRIGSMDERKSILESKDPCVIISTSGMLVGGPSVTWLQNLAEDKKNSLIFVGYQGEGTLGRRIQKGWKEVPMERNGKTVSTPMNMRVETITGLSGHSDYKQLVNYLLRLKQKPERIIVGHGESSKCMEFAREAHRIIGCETIAPKLLETIRLR